MVANKHISKIIIAVMAAAVVLCFLAIAYSGTLTEVLGGTGVRMEYESELFDTDEIISVDIRMDEETWNEMLANAVSEEYYVCSVVINGQKVNNVAIRPKGNTSLSAIAMDPDTDRFSLKLEFDHFVDGQTCFGLDKLILNNNYADATNMKEAVIYDMYRFIGAEASLYNYAKVSVNGEYWGVYLALEGVEESFMLRNFGTQDGELYKPDSMEMGGNSSSASGSAPGGMGGFSMGGGGANLNYTSDDLDSYSTIWEGEITGTGTADHRRVVTALKNISEGTDLETYLEIDNILKYMAVHTFSVNMDSLSGSMAHNYYLYEYDGQLNIFPWDYNLSFGGMSMGNNSDGTSVVNDAIDTPFSGTKFFDALLSNEEYLERYHEYLRQLVDEYVNGGRFDEVYERIRSQIDTLVETDPTAFYSYDEYQTAAELLYETVKLRAESIDGQLDGTIPSTDSGQREDSSSLIDASHIDITAMGQFSMGGSSGGGFGGQMPGNIDISDLPDRESFDPENMPDMGNFDPGNLPEGFNMDEMPEGFDPGSMPGGFNTDDMPEGFNPGSKPENFNMDDMPEGFDPGNMPEGGFSFGGGNRPGDGSSDSETTQPDQNGSGQESAPDMKNSDQRNTQEETAPSVPDDSAEMKDDSPDQQDKSGSTDKGSSPSGSANGSFSSRPSSFPGMSGQSSAIKKNLITYGICMAILIAALLIINRRRRRK